MHKVHKNLAIRKGSRCSIYDKLFGKNEVAVAAGKVNLKGIVTDIFDFDDIQNAMDRSVADKANIVKAVVRIAGEG